jgi:hypothetical protein
MHPNIHGVVLRRLVLSWLILSAAIGGIVFYLEAEKVDDFVLDLAVKESKAFTAGFDSSDPALLARIRQEGAEIVKSHFVVVELYDAERRKIVEAVAPGKEAIEARLKQYVHSFPMEDSVYYNKFWIDNRVFMQVLLPLQRNGGLAGYFEGVYEVDSGTVENTRAMSCTPWCWWSW